MTSDDARLRAAFAALADRASPTPLCPEPAALWSAVNGEAPSSETRRLVLHTAECPACAEAWRLAREMREPKPAASEPVAPPAARSRRPGIAAALLAAAAGVVLATALALIARGPARVSPSSFREGETHALRSLVSESHALPRGQCVLRWTDGPPGTRYALRVVTERLDPIEQVQGLQRPEHQVPEAKLRPLAPGARLFWQVEATGPDGARQTSATFVSRLE